MKKLLFDTDVLIEYLRGNENAKAYLDQIENVIYMSSVTMAELYAGVREGDEYTKLEIFIDTFEVISLNKNIAKIGGLLRNQYKSTHGTGLADALIAATAKTINAQVVTFNSKHFPMCKDVIKPYERN
ncbi:MAG TPA: type II toxin-antitoxin system VapC family toxin [Aeromonadales bacterium]|nr:type II toxin-antitoxin system VapC family toxin [Aeromonadales bacterium]